MTVHTDHRLHTPAVTRVRSPFSFAPQMCLRRLCSVFVCTAMTVCLWICVCVTFVFLCVLPGEVVNDEGVKTVNVEPDKSASVGAKKAVAAQKTGKVAPVKAVKPKSVRSKRTVAGAGKAVSPCCVGALPGARSLHDSWRQLCPW